MLTLVVKVVAPAGKHGTWWMCRCDCGNNVVKYRGHLLHGTAKTCGCFNPGARTHGMSGTPEYRAWDNARSRCYSKKNRKFPLYGGRGISVCDRWRHSFSNFIEDMGARPSPAHSLERLNGNGNYEPRNCVWASIEQQNNNRSFNRHVTVNGKRLTIAQAARETGIPHATILSRLDSGKSDMEATKGWQGR